MKKIIAPAAFLLILALLFCAVVWVFQEPVGHYWAEGTGAELVHKYKNQYDVCFFGTSTAISNISNQDLYEEYGIAGVSMGTPEQNMYLTRYLVEEVLKYQRSAIIVVGVDGLFQLQSKVLNDAKTRGDYIVHAALDGIRTPEIKYRALEKVRALDPDLDIWEFYSELYRNHSDWEMLAAKDYSSYSDLECMNGNIALLEMADGESDTYSLDDPDSSKLNQSAVAALDEIVQLCRDGGAELILLTPRADWTQTQHRMVEELAAGYGVTYIDFNEHMEEVSFSHVFDRNDHWHFNLLGAIKQTRFLGEYLKQNYDISDKRNDPAYDRYEEQIDAFHMQLDYLNTKQKLLEATTFYDHMAALDELDKEKYLIFIAVDDDASVSLADRGQELLEQLGLKRDVRSSTNNSYAAVIDGETIREVISPFRDVTIEGTIDDVEYSITSGSDKSGIEASILINNKEELPKGRGFDIVVYSREMDKVISSASFDTSFSENPLAVKFTKIKEKEVPLFEREPNVWTQ